MEKFLHNDLKVIDDALICESVDKKDAKTDKSEVDYKEIDKLVFSYKKIYKIQALRGLERLEVLKLDNNNIMKIENLEELTNLKRLDLSFNRITVVEGLSALGSLEDLNISNNRIERLDWAAFRGLKRISLISLSNNQMKDLMQVLKALKPLTTLEVLTVIGNPFTNDAEHKNYIFANLPSLKYLDYTYIDENTRSGADDYKYQADFNNYAEAHESEQDGQEMVRNDEASVRLQAYKLFAYDKYLFQGNHDMETLLGLKTAFEESTTKFNENVKNLVDSIRHRLTEACNQRNETVEKFEGAFYKMIDDSEASALELVQHYESKKKKLVRLIEDNADVDKPKLAGEIRAELRELDEALVGMEMNLNKRLKQAYTILETNLKTLYNEMEAILVGESGLKAIEEFISQFFAKFLDEALAEAERYEKLNNYQETESQNSNNEAKVDNKGIWTEDQEALLENKDELKNIISTIKESIDNKHRSVDSLIRKDILAEKQNYLVKINNLIKEFNRKNISNIVQLISKEEHFWNCVEEAF